MTTSSEHDSVLGFFESMWKTFLKWKVLFSFMLVLFLAGGIFYSAFKPVFQTEALILIRSDEDPTRLRNEIYDSPANESFISTQTSLLRSRLIIESTLKDFYQKKDISSSEIKEFEKALAIQRYPFNNLILLKLRWSDVDEAPSLLASLLNSYKAWHDQSQIEDAKHLDAFLTQEILRSKKELKHAERELEMFLREYSISSFDEYYQERIRKFADDEALLDQNETRLIQIQKSRDATLKRLEEEEGIDISGLVDTDTIAHIQEGLQQARIDLLDLKKRFEDESDEVTSQVKKIQYLEKELSNHIGASIFNNTEAVRSRVEELRDRFIEMDISLIESHATVENLRKIVIRNGLERQRLSGLELENMRLRRMIQIKEQSYLNLYRKREDNLSRMAEKNMGSMKTIYPPTAPRKMNSFLKSIAVSLLSGLFTILLLLYWIAYWSPFVHQALLLSQITGKPVVSVLPHTNRGKNKTPLIPQTSSEFFESFRKIATHLVMNNSTPRVLHVTSPRKHSGKTLFTINLALTLAEAGRRVLIVDCCHRTFNVYQCLGQPKPQYDKSDKPSWKDTLTLCEPSGLAITAFSLFEDSPLELVQTNKLDNIFSDMKKEYDWILMDSLSVLDHTYPLVLSKAVDWNLCVVNLSMDKRTDILKTTRILKSSKDNWLGWIVNQS